MVSWYADGGVSGYKDAAGIPVEWMRVADKNVIHLPQYTAGTIDANGSTRLQYPVWGPNFRTSIDAAARLTFAGAEVGTAFLSGRLLAASMFVTDAANFPPGKIPTPAEILALGDAKVSTHRSVGLSPAGSYELEIFGPIPQPNRKYWVLVAPTTIPGPVFVPSASTAPSILNDIPIGDVNVNGRAVSMWGNRTPAAPIITAPAADSVHSAGSSFLFSYASADPDGVFGDTARANADRAGVQVQYAPRPTVANPTPTWIDLPIASRTGTLFPGDGWYIDQSSAASPSDVSNNGAYTLWLATYMQIRCGSNTLAPGEGILPSGNWQIRMRTFDYGHPYPTFVRPLNAPNNDYYPSNYPILNTSPWSTPVKVSIAAQVPQPVPVYPINNTALAEDKTVTLSWQYFNTYSPPKAQMRREVDIRKVGDAAWTTLTNSLSASTSYTILPTGSGSPAPYEYQTDLGFEAGTLGGWSTGGTGTLTAITSTPPTVHSGTRALQMATSGAASITKTFPLVALHTTFTFSGWTYLGPGTDAHYVYVEWIGPGITDTVSVLRPGGAGWARFTTPPMARPAGATDIRITVYSYISGASSNGDRFDDFSLTAFTGSYDVGFTPVSTTQYEWRVRTTDTSGVLSNYSTIARFWIVPALNSGDTRPLPVGTIDGATLGCGTHRVFVYRRGGKVRVGELTGLSYVDWGRLRDDISDAKIVISDWDIDCGNLLAKLQTWAYELVIYRDNGYSIDRVWEGPITLLTYARDKVTIQAKDVMAYAYRRIIKQEMNDRLVGDTVTSRAARVLQNVFAPDDPNVLAYLQVLSDPADSIERRNLPAFSRTAYEEIDDMAANQGLDYTAVGRSILLWGTRHRIGTLPEFRDADLGASPIVSEYGMSMANFYSVADGTGVHGDANRLDVSGNDPIYGLVEMLSSSWASDTPEQSGIYTGGQATVIASFEGYAEKSIAARYPPPVVVRVPDNTSLNPSTTISIQHLVPGVVIPLRSTGTLRTVSANQKLDSVSVTEQGGAETITIVMSPFSREDTAAPEGGDGG